MSALCRPASFACQQGARRAPAGGRERGSATRPALRAMHLLFVPACTERTASQVAGLEAGAESADLGIRGCTLRLCAKLGDEKGVDVFMDLEGKSSSGLNDEEDALMNEDMQRLASDRQAASSQAAEEPRQSLQEAASSFGDSVQDFVDKILIGDFFFIIFIMFWGIAGLGERAAANTTHLIDAWLPLWPIVFQPALGLLMLGTIVQGTAGYIKDAAK